MKIRTPVPGPAVLPRAEAPPRHRYAVAAAAPLSAAVRSRVVRGVEAGGAAAPLLCAAHCIAAPLAVALVPALAAAEAHERAAMGASLVLALLAVLAGVRVHRRAGPLAVVGAGALLWGATLALPRLPEAGAAIAASLLMAAGTLWSARLRHRATCAGCGCPAAHGGAE
ncbi:MAG TPA: MerC family mercury resistance protein [Longimicrobium sp.]|jgi:hypothetical protein|uniref:MerC family mercury resistance protein n=1 Tax=Longimicrobium sp. TaxID=2029185 RepID=UPI002ED795B3